MTQTELKRKRRACQVAAFQLAVEELRRDRHWRARTAENACTVVAIAAVRTSDAAWEAFLQAHPELDEAELLLMWERVRYDVDQIGRRRQVARVHQRGRETAVEIDMRRAGGYNGEEMDWDVLEADSESVLD